MEAWISQHGIRSVLIVLAIAQIAGAMPTPGAEGAPNNWVYRWAFGIAHAIVNLPRLLIAFFPQYASIFGAAAANGATDRMLQNAADKGAILDKKG